MRDTGLRVGRGGADGSYRGLYGRPLLPQGGVARAGRVRRDLAEGRGGTESAGGQGSGATPQPITETGSAYAAFGRSGENRRVAWWGGKRKSRYWGS